MCLHCLYLWHRPFSKSSASASKPIASASKPRASTSKPSASTSIATAASVQSFYDSMLEAAEEEQDECTDEVVSVSSSDHDHTVQYLSTGDMAMVRISNGKKIVAKMKPGDSGFCIATFDSGTEYETELPNSTFLKFEGDVQKKPSMNSNKKRPAAVVSTAVVSTKKQKPAEVAAGSPALHLQAATQEYVVMLYKSPPTWAIRERCGEKKQVFSIPVKDRTPEQMLSLVKGAIQRLTSGEDKESVKAWATA